MFSLTGIVCVDNDKTNEDNIRESLHDWEFANELKDKLPEEINLPILSTKERLKLQSFLPNEENTNIDIGTILYEQLGYNISFGSEKEKTIKLLNMYAKFYRYYPYFIRGNP